MQFRRIWSRWSLALLLESDDPRDFAGDRHGSSASWEPRRPAADDLQGPTGSLNRLRLTLILVQHLVRLAVTVHGDGNHFLLQSPKIATYSIAYQRLG